MNAPRSLKPSARVRLNVGGRRFETTVATLAGPHGGDQGYLPSLLRHAPEEELAGELFIDRDGDAFAPLLNYMRTGTLSIPPSTSEEAVRAEADFYCIALPEPGPAGKQVIRCDGLYLSFGGYASQREVGCGDDETAGSSDARAYLIFHQDGGASLGRREADGQWTALRCRYRCLAGGLLLVHRWEPGEGSSQDEDGGADGEGTEGAPHGMGPLELSAVVLGADFIRVMACRRVGRLENPFHFFESTPPRPGRAFISQVAQPAPGRPAGRVVISFEEDAQVGVLVTSSQPGWSSAAVTRYSARRGTADTSAHNGAAATGRLSPRAAAGAGAVPAAAGARAGPPPPPTVAPAALPVPVPEQAMYLPPDSLCHVEIVDNGNFSRTVDLVSLGDHGLIEFVQLNAQHEPQLIWYRPMAKTANPWIAQAPARPPFW